MSAVTFILANPVDETAEQDEVLPQALALACTQCPFNPADFGLQPNLSVSPTPRTAAATAQAATAENEEEDEGDDDHIPLFRMPRLPSSGYRRLGTAEEPGSQELS